MAPRMSAIGWIYGLAMLALACVLVSLFGNVLASVTEGADFGVFTLANYSELLADPKLVPVLLRTLAQGGGTVATMLAFALPIAWLIARTDLPFKNGILTLFTAQLAIPGFITAMTYVWMFNPNSGIVNILAMQIGLAAGPIFDIYGLGWICFLQGLVLVPAAVFMILPSFQNVDATLEEAALVSGVPRLRSFRRIVLPLLAPGILAATLLFFIIGIELFDFVGLIGMPGRVEVLSLWVYDAMHPSTGFPDYGAAGATSMVMFVVSAVAIAFYIRLLRNAQRYAVLRGKMRLGEMLSLGRWRSAALGFVGLWLLLAFVMPIVTLIWVSLLPYLQPPSIGALATLTFRNFGFALQYLSAPLLNTLALAVGVVVLALAWSASASWIVTRSRSRFGRWLDVAIFLTPAVPSMAAAVAFQMMGIAVNRWVPVYGTVWLMILAMATRMLAFCTRAVNASGVQMHAELDEAAYATGVSRIVAFRRIFLPMVAPALAYAALMVGMLTARELTLPLMMDTGRFKLVSTLVFDLQTNGSFGTASAIGLYMVVVLTALVLVARRLAGASVPGGAAEGKRVRRPVWQSGIPIRSAVASRRHQPLREDGMRRAARSRTLRLVVAGLLAFLAHPASAQQGMATNLPSAVAALVPQAKAEGAIASAYAGDFDPTQIAALSKGISDFYGLSFTLQLPTVLHPVKAAEIVQGAKMGVESGIDLFWTGSAVGMLLEKGGVVADFDWIKDLGIDDSLRWGTNAVRIHDATLAGVAYNTGQVTPDAAPHSYEDLVSNPAWKGRIAAPRAPNVFVVMSYAIGDASTRKLIKELVDVQDLKILPTYPDVTNRVLSGEFAIGLGVTATLQHRRGAPLEAASIEPVIVTPWALWLMKDAKHPASAKLFGYWLSSPAGQKVLSDAAALSLYTTPGTDLWRQVQGKKVVVVPHEFFVEMQPKLAPVYGKLLGIR